MYTISKLYNTYNNETVVYIEQGDSVWPVYDQMVKREVRLGDPVGTAGVVQFQHITVKLSLADHETLPLLGH